MKLIVEMDMPRNCRECALSTTCSFCEGYDDYCVLAPKAAEYEWNFFDGIEPSERPSWCPIKGVLPDEQMPKEGEWIEVHDWLQIPQEERGTYRCSACGQVMKYPWNYCPNCGSRMQTVTDCHALEEANDD